MNPDNIPVINISRLDITATRNQLDLACREWGFFQIVEHGIDMTVIDELKREMRKFFAETKSQKQKVARTSVNPWGYFDAELTRNTRDWKEIFDYGQSDSSCQIRAQWPGNLPGFRPAIQAFYAACYRLSMQLISAISSNLGMPEDHIESMFRGNHSSFLRLNYYPVCPNPEQPISRSEPTKGHLGLNRHTDAGALTILLQDHEPGLEVYNGRAWHLIRPMNNALTVNIGDIIQVWSNDQYQAALHRVTANSSRERFSAPFFFNPGFDANYQPLEPTVGENRPPVYKSINWGEFRARRAAGDYSNQGEEIQISQYRNIQENSHGVH